MHTDVRKNIFLVDDHPIFLDAIGAAIEHRFPDSIVTMFGSMGEIHEGLRRGVIPTLAVVDINLPDGNGVDLISELHTAYAIPIIAFSGHSDRDTIKKCIKSGAIGYVPKSSPTEILYTAIDVAISGGQYFPPSFLRNEPKKHEKHIPLTKRQRDVLDLVLLARSNKTIATALCITEGTVKNHVSDLLTIFDASSRNELILKAQQIHIIQ